MIRIKARYYPEEDLTRIILRHKKSCTMEFLAVISRMMDEIEKYGDTPRKDIYKYLKQMDKEKEEQEIEVL